MTGRVRRVDERSLLDRVVKAARLFDCYGGLLTAKQREVLELHYFQDLSLGEIAGNWETSRQAVYDLARRALGNLEAYESRLGLVARAQAEAGRRARLAGLAGSAAEHLAAAGEVVAGLVRRELDQARAALERLRDELERWED